MIRLKRLGAIGLMGVIFVAAGAEIGSLPADQLAKAARSDSISIPTSGELFAALEKPGKTNWSGQYRAPMPMTYRNRAQIALNLGSLIADGFIAVEAKDSQQVKNIGTDIIKLAKAMFLTCWLSFASTAINPSAIKNIGTDIIKLAKAM